MGSMSASDAAPLPRLGEVYFDVRGESRSMRLSWYADTGVAVFSIWQGGTCTGTFRLPIADLPRMVDALQRGPHGDARGDAGDPRDARGTAERRGRADQRAPGGYEDEPTGVYRGDVAGHAYQDDPGAHYRDADYPGDPLTGRYPVADPRPARYSEDPLTGAYPEDPHSVDYPAGAGYPDGSAAYPEDTAGYPPSSRNDGYSPARPYVTPVPGSTGPAAEGRGHGRRRAADPDESDLSPDSFPYGRPPAEPEPPRRGR